jgi:GT2 family glycosyltransferase
VPLPSVHAIILAYNDRDAVIRCLESVAASSYPALRVHVVDNASRDDTSVEVRNRFPRFHLVRNERNLGFGGGCNRGIEAALADGADHVLLLNQDSVVSPDLVATLAKFLEERPSVGVVGAKTYSLAPRSDGSPRLLYAGSWRRLLPLRQKIPGIERPDSGRFANPLRTDYVWGHGMMIRASALERAGLFDPDFFMYYEDLDLCRRIEAAGFEIWVEPRAVMWHDSPDGARAVESEYWRWECKMRSADIFHAKNHGRVATRLLGTLTVLAEGQELLRHLRFRAFGHLVGAYAKHLLHGGGRGSPGSAPTNPTGGERR